MATEPIKPYVWRNLPEGHVRHALMRSTLSFQEQPALCGVTPLWLLPASALWQNDIETLQKLRPCKSCVTRLRSEGFE